MDAVSAALAGSSGFSVEERGKPVPPAAPVIELPPPGTVVLWRLENRAASLWTLLSALKAGVVPILLSATTPVGKLQRLGERFPRFARFDGRKLVLAEDPAIRPELLMGFMTSGSTGDPKLVVSTEARLAAGVRAIHESQGLEAVKATAVLLPLGYSYAFVNQALWSVVYGRRLLLTPGMVMPADTMRIMREAKPELLCLVNNQLRALVDRGFTEGEPLDFVEVVNFAGAPFPVADFEALRRFLPKARAMNNYGCTEAMPRLTATEVRSAAHDVTDVGPAIGDLKLRIATGDRVEFSGSSAALGTLSPEGEIVEVGPWVPSGDLGRLDEAGHLHVLGRADQVANVAGERLSLIEVQEQLRRAGFSRALAWVEKEDGEDQVVAVVSGEGVEPKQIQATLRMHLPRAAWPAWMAHTPDWKLNANGKTDRVALIEAAKSGALARVWPPKR